MKEETDKMFIQRELKFKVHNLILDISQYSSEVIEQFFINNPILNEERKFRKTVVNGKTIYSYQTKTKGGLERHVMPVIEITAEQYYKILSQKTGEVVKKKRYLLYYDGINITDQKINNGILIKLDIYEERLDGLITAEVPVIDIEDAKAVYLPINFGVLEDVTENPIYKNAELSETVDLSEVLYKKQYEVTFNNLIRGIKKTDRNFGNKFNQDLKFLEETGELAETILKDLQWNIEAKIKGTIAEELFDVIYYLLAKLIENNINYLASYNYFDQVEEYVEKLNQSYNNKQEYQKFLLKKFQILNGKIAEKELENKIYSDSDKKNYAWFINDLILIVFELAKINNVSMSKAALVKELKNSIKYNRASHFLVPKQEIERKYTVEGFEVELNLSQFKYEEIQQYYLSIKPERRVRKIGEKYMYTEKSEGGLLRDEPVDIKITEEEYKAYLKEGYVGNEISKTRYYLYFNPLTETYYSSKKEGTVLIELDIYHGDFEGKCTLETAFESIVEMISLNNLPYINGLCDVTEDFAYKNKNIAINGWPQKQAKNFIRKLHKETTYLK